ncbi:oxidoreductase [Desulfuromonas versatilis]|uniref:Oxidoreductase n=1 Tax=Desulfuromonas versatilis TaxID=2802975 RepID=A0ABM8HRI4_9BACT|nr:SDR family oxidoreductase [Desulfuromonas versatilis]BCR04891.1 oxidoreductase [Desulfuromonas versatilis]
MNIEGKVVLVTGANGGIGQALVRALLARGATKIYAAARTTKAACCAAGQDDNKVVAVKLDITRASEVEAAAKQCTDVDILINNAGVNRCVSLLSPAGMEAAREEMEVNFFGTLAMCQAFAPVLESRGGGAIVNICSIIGLVNMPLNGTYCASKAAAHSLLQGLRGELAARQVRVFAVYPGPVETRMTSGQKIPKTSPAQLANAILTGLENGDEDIFPDPLSQNVHALLTKDAKQAEKHFAFFVPG